VRHHARLRERNVVAAKMAAAATMNEVTLYVPQVTTVRNHR